MVNYSRSDPPLPSHPDPLPPSDVDFSGMHNQAVEVASQFRGASHRLSELSSERIDDFLWEESKASCRIEGIPKPRSTVSINPETGRIDVSGVQDYHNALTHAVSTVDSPQDFTPNLLHDLHSMMFETHQNLKTVGEYRNVVVHVGQDPAYVPPAPEAISRYMSNLFEFIHTDTDTHWLIDTALTHYQFETIHPYLDGNGRVGRLLSVAQFCTYDDVVPFAPVSIGFAADRSEYFTRLRRVDQNGEWVEWVDFFISQLQEAIEKVFAEFVEE